MVLKSKLVWTHLGKHATLRTLKTSHITSRYISAISAGPEFIRGAQVGDDYGEQRRYVTRVRKSKTDVLLGLFCDEQLIGTCGLQLSYSESIKKKLSFSLGQNQNVTTVGLFIFQDGMRGQGIGHCLLFGGCFLFDREVVSRQFGAEIDRRNRPSIALFEKCGFSKKGSDEKNVILFAKKDELKRPANMTEIKLLRDMGYE